MDGSACLCPYVSESVDCVQASLYECNGAFVGVTRRDELSYRTLEFPKWSELESSAVKTYFGPHFLHSGVVYGHSSHNYSMMMRRQFALRTERGYDDWLRGSQENIASIDGFREWKETVRERIEKLSPDCDIQTMLHEYAHRTHPKRKLRIRSYNMLRDEGKLEDYSAYCVGVSYKLKIPEFAKPGKYPRVIGDFGVAGSLLGGFLLEFAKKAFVEPITVNGMVMVFVPCPSTNALIEVFRDLVDGHGKVLYFFSDDSCLSFTLPNGRRVMANVDIKKCDCSIGPAIFKCAQDILSSEGLEKLAAAVVTQCSTPCTLRDRNYKKMVSVNCLRPALSSGSVLTTFLDNIATSVIGLSFSSEIDNLSHNATDVEISAALELAASFAGFEISLEICSSYHSLQFLKHSPCRGIDGQLYPVLNLGVVLRTLGQKDGHVAHFSFADFKRKSEQYNSGVVKGFKHMGNNSLRKVLCERFDAPSAPVYKNYWSAELSTYQVVSTPFVPDHELIVRYSNFDPNFTLEDYFDLLNYTEHSEFGDAIDCVASRVILKADYGL